MCVTSAITTYSDAAVWTANEGGVSPLGVYVAGVLAPEAVEGTYATGVRVHTCRHSSLVPGGTSEPRTHTQCPGTALKVMASYAE